LLVAWLFLGIPFVLYPFFLGEEVISFRFPLPPLKSVYIVCDSIKNL